MGRPSQKEILRNLLGSPASVAVVDLPSRLAHVVGSLPLGHRYLVNRLIDDHTLFPYYAPFLPPDRIKLVRKDMQGFCGSAIHTRIGIMASQIHLPRRLRFCPCCAKDEIRRLGEPYWHRLHQVTGVDVCPHHGVFLEPTPAYWPPARRNEFVTTRSVLGTASLRRADVNNPNHDDQIAIAQDVQWLLTSKVPSPGVATIRERYLRLLNERDLAHDSGRVRVRELLEAFSKRFSDTFLWGMGCGLNLSSEHNWLVRLTRRPKGAQHPLHHLLLFRFLGSTAEQFFGMSNVSHPFGIGPWPCLNPASDHYRQARILQCHVVPSSEAPKPIGVFRCDCGFDYVRNGPDRSVDDRFRVGKVQSYGQCWETLLKSLWATPEISLREISRRLGVDPTTTKRHALRLHLCFPREGKRVTMKAPPQPPGRHDAVPNKRDVYRDRWLQALASTPRLTRTALRQTVPGVYTWLRRHDPEWLHIHLPARQRRFRIPSRVDWEERDRFLVTQVHPAVERLLGRGGRPMRLTPNLIGKETGHGPVIQKHKAKLPLTHHAITRMAETREAFAIRRVRWAAQILQEQGQQLKGWQVVRKAGLCPATMSMAGVRQAISAITALTKVTVDKP